MELYSHYLHFSLGLQKLPFDHCLFVDFTALSPMVLVIYVDEILIAGNDTGKSLPSNKLCITNSLLKILVLLLTAWDLKNKGNCLFTRRRRSLSGCCVFPGGALISWKTKKQQAVSRCSTEAEYCSLAAATSELLWINHLLDALRISNQRKYRSSPKSTLHDGLLLPINFLVLSLSLIAIASFQIQSGYDSPPLRSVVGCMALIDLCLELLKCQ
ncbi:uncharacterized protein LOC127263854 [Andrographis paniculata]|uniref:uncharacterized protein LOC127263854 n=1 Tax=Andrographis paniculata TaxID=175694 RepID=UPI0021E81A84|nr:uncharacterized protein LOC127263854 [Andrographis paniculata]